MLKCVLIEDSKKDAKIFKNNLNLFADKNNISVQLDVFENALLFLPSYQADYDIIFLDIELPFMNGMEVATKIRDKDKQVVIVFITNMAQYAIEGYSVAAFDYILKPVNYYEMSLKLKRLISHLASQNDEWIAIRMERDIIRLKLKEICFLEVDSHYVIWHTVDTKYRSLCTLKSLEKSLPDYFVQISRWNIVNMKFVESIKENEIHMGSNTLHISRNKYREFVERFAKYLIGGD